MPLDPKTWRIPSADPENAEHVAILGRTGSGKTTFATWLLSLAPFDKMPYIAVDYKHDGLLASIGRIKEIGLRDAIPREPGIYVLRPHPSDEDGVEHWLWKLWERGSTGLFVDEAYLLPNKKACKNICSQGRSLRIPCIFASQRPVSISRSIFTEASHVSVFRLQHDDDKKTVACFTPPGMIDRRLPAFHSCWYNAKDHNDDEQPEPWYEIAPVPPAQEIVESINARLSPGYKVT